MELEVVPVALAFAAGMASFLSPCHLVVMPAFLAVLGRTVASGGQPPSRGVVLRRAALFVFGFSLVMVALGMSVGLVGYLVWDRLPLLRRASGLLLIGLGLHLAGLLRVPALHRDLRLRSAETPPGDRGAFAMGLVFGFGWTPCVGPILAAILWLAAETVTVWRGGALLAVYALGLALPFLALAGLVGRAHRVVALLRRSSASVELASGALIAGMGILVFTNQLAHVAALFGVWPPQ